MLNDRDDKNQGHEESEYHFTDDDMGYESEDEPEASKPPSPEKKESIFKRLTRSRRMLISIVLFFILMFIVYMMMSSSPTPEIVPPALTTRQPAMVSSPPLQPQQVVQAPQAPAATIPTVMPVESQPAVSSTQIGVVPSSQVDTKIAALNKSTEELINRMQLDYTQKISEVSAQNKFLQDELRALNARVATMEAQFNQLMQSVIKPGAAGRNAALPGAQPREPKISYNVQAIIPGRAWLKSDSGEAVTVAEGDTLKDLGRVTKIDPYDGVVEINTGNKVVHLTYGSGG